MFYGVEIACTYAICVAWCACIIIISNNIVTKEYPVLTNRH